MGIIKFTPFEAVPKVSCSSQGVFRKLYTSNWRLLRDIVGKKEIIVTLSNFRKFKIHNISVEEFHDNNIQMGTIEKPFRYIHNSLPCSVCDGSGCVDWIQKVMVRKIRRWYNTPKYSRDSKHVSLLKYISLLKPPSSIRKDERIYGSVPTLPFGFEICSTCKGTGDHSLRFIDYLR